MFCDSGIGNSDQGWYSLISENQRQDQMPVRSHRSSLRHEYFQQNMNVSILLVIRSVTDVLRAQSRFVKLVGDEATDRTPYTFYKPTLGPKYVSDRPYNEIITPQPLFSR